MKLNILFKSSFEISQSLSLNAPASGQSITTSQNERNKHLYRAAFALATAVAVYAAIKFYNFYQLNQRENVTCIVGENESEMATNFTSYLSEAEKGNAISQYCVASMYKQGEGVEKSTEKAREWFKKAADQGLLAAKKDLCRPSTFEGWNDVDGAAELDGFAQYCCPPPSKCLCPWHINEHPSDFRSSDAPTCNKRTFG